MKISTVEARNFRSYQKLNWSLPTTGLYLIDGENLDTGRNNMTGKTTLVDSIFWALYGYLPKWGGPKGGPVDAVIKRGEAKCVVQVTVTHAGKQILVRRERPNKLFLEVDGIEMPGKSSELDDRIADLIGMTAEQFLTAVYISQDRKQSFFTMNEGDRTLLLSQVSKVEDINRAMETSKKTKSELELSIEKQKSFIEALDLQARANPTQILEAEHEFNKRTDTWQKHLDALAITKKDNDLKASLQADESRQKVRILEDILNQKRADLTMHLREQEAELAILEAEQIQPPRMEIQFTQRIEELKKSISEATERNQQSINQEGRNAQAKAALKNIADEIESVMQGKCDHCKQDLPQAQRDAHIEKLLANVSRWEGMIKDPEPRTDVIELQHQLNDAMQAYAKRKSELESGPKQIEAKINLQKMQVASERQALKALEDSHHREVAALDSSVLSFIRDLTRHYDQAEAHVKGLKEMVDLSELGLLRAQATAKDLENQIQTAKLKLSTLQAELDQVLDLIDLFKGFRQVCFEDLIARISDRAGFLLSLMTDGVYTTRIDQMGETSKGEAKLILKPMITKGGQDVPLDDLSGGARRTVMLAYDVAVAEAVGDSSVLVLDEALDGLDHMGKTEAMRLLEEVSQTRAVLVIDHSSEIKSAFQDVLKVTYRDGTSQLENSYGVTETPDDLQTV
jgi:DNA repair exonuclease SbcCD ATPase subunit